MQGHPTPRIPKEKKRPPQEIGYQGRVNFKLRELRFSVFSQTTCANGYVFSSKKPVGVVGFFRTKKALGFPFVTVEEEHIFFRVFAYTLIADTGAITGNYFTCPRFFVRATFFVPTTAKGTSFIPDYVSLEVSLGDFQTLHPFEILVSFVFLSHPFPKQTASENDTTRTSMSGFLHTPHCAAGFACLGPGFEIEPKKAVFFVFEVRAFIVRGNATALMAGRASGENRPS